MTTGTGASASVLHAPTGAITKAVTPPASGGVITGAVTLSAQSGVNIWALSSSPPGVAITIGSAFSAPEGVFKVATGHNYTNWRKRDPPEARLPLYSLNKEMGRQLGKITSNNTRAMQYHQKLVVLQQKDMNILTQMKQEKSALKITPWRLLRPLKR